MSYIAFIAENYENQLALDAEVYGPFDTDEEANEWMEAEIASRERRNGEFMGFAFVKQIYKPEPPEDDDG